jgi:hypothetical protein
MVHDSPPFGAVTLRVGVATVVVGVVDDVTGGDVVVVLVVVVVVGVVDVVVGVVVVVVVGGVVDVVAGAGGALMAIEALLIVAVNGWPFTSPKMTFDRESGHVPTPDFAVNVNLAKTPSENAFLPGVIITPLTALITPLVAVPVWKKVLAPLWERRVPSSTLTRLTSEEL